MSSLVSSENGTARSPVLAVLSMSVQLTLILVTAILRVEMLYTLLAKLSMGLWAPWSDL